MLHAWRSRLHLPGRRAFVIGSALLVVMITGVVAEIITLPHRPVFRHVPNAPNLGTSLLLLSSPNTSPYSNYITRLTMTRTSDGTTLWQYDLPGTLAGNESGDINQSLQEGTIQIANGVVYFAVVDMPADPPGSTESLIALRASDGALLWKQEVQMACAQMIGVSDGVVICTGQAPPSTHSNIASPQIFSGYDAKTGARVWQRSPNDIAGHSIYGYPALIDGVLYVIDRFSNTGSAGAAQRGTTIYALQASTGETLWQYTQSGPTLTGPVLGDQGVAVIYSITGDFFKNPSITLVGLQESDGTVLWHRSLPAGIQDIPTGGTGIMESSGVAYFVTTTSGASIPELNALRLQDGSIAWQQPVTPQASDMWYITLAAGSIYVATADPFQGPHPSFNDPSIAAFQASSGALRWRYQPAAADYPEVVADATNATVLGGDSLYGVQASDGAPLWQQTFKSSPHALNADGSLIAWYDTTTNARTDTGASHICALQPESGAQSWCQDIDGWLAAVLAGP